MKLSNNFDLDLKNFLVLKGTQQAMREAVTASDRYDNGVPGSFDRFDSRFALIEVARLVDKELADFMAEFTSKYRSAIDDFRSKYTSGSDLTI